MSNTTDYLNSTVCAAPALRTDIAVSGLLTACDAVIPTPSEVEALYKDDEDFRLMSAQFLFDWEAKACRAKQNGLYNFISASKVNMSKSLGKLPRPDGLTEIMPFVKVKRKGPTNNNFWSALSGAACDSDGTTNAAGTHWKMSMSSPTGIPLHKDWFIPKEYVFVEGLDGSGNMIKWSGKIVSSTVNGTTDITVVMEPAMTNSNLPSARKANPVNGLATRGVANVSKFESFCAQPPGLIEGQLDPYWLGWARTTFKSDSSYEKWLELVLADNKLYKEIFHLPTADYNRQVAEDFQSKQVESFMNNVALEGQTLADYAKAPEDGGLPLITTSADGIGGSRCVGRIANPIGVFEQHVACQRAVDAQGVKLCLPALFQSLYKMKRIRKAVGAPTNAQNVFEIGMPSNYWPLFHKGMLDVYNSQWNGKVEWHLMIDPKAKVAPMGFLYYEYPLVFPAGTTIRVILDDYFDDYAAAQTALGTALGDSRYENLGRRLWILDWSGIYMAITDSKTVNSNPGSNLQQMQNLGIIDPCIMETISESYVLRTWQWTAIVDCPSSNLIIQNLSAEVPEASLLTTDYDVNA